MSVVRAPRRRDHGKAVTCALAALALAGTALWWPGPGERADGLTTSPSQVTLANEIVAGPATDPTTGVASLTYEIRVVNPTPLTASYTVGHTLRFGVGVVVQAATLSTVPAGASPNGTWDGTTSRELTAGPTALPPGAVHAWRVTVESLADPSVTTPGAPDGDCALDAGESGTGMLTTATITVAGSTVAEDRCAPATLPRVTAAATVSSGPDTGSSTTVRAGDVVDWTVAVDDAVGVPGTGTGEVHLPDEATLVPGSLEVPAGWLAEFSVDGGVSWSSDEPSAGVDGVRGVIRAGAPFAPAPVTSASTGTGGDGYSATPVGDRIYNVFHHTVARLVCTDRVSGARCDGLPQPRFFVPTSGAAAPTSQPGDPTQHVLVGNRSVVAFDAPTQRAWIAGARWESDSFSPGSFFCMDLSVSPPIGCSPAAMVRATPSDVYIAYGGGHYHPSFTMVEQDVARRRAYAIGPQADVYCLDLATSELCDGWMATDNQGVTFVGFDIDSENEPLARIMPGTTHMIITGSPVGSVDRVTCIDITDGSRCDGWPATPQPFATDRPTARVSSFPFPIFTGGDLSAATGACVHDQESTRDRRTTHCVALADGTTMAVPPGLEASYPADPTFVMTFVNVGDWALTAAGRMFSIWNDNGVTDDRLSCFDHATGQVCDGWEGAVEVYGPGPQLPYAATVDQLDPECVWLLNDFGELRSFDSRATWTEPCSNFGAAFTVTPREYYCTSSSPVISAWRDVRLVDVAASDYSAVLITVRDDTGQTVPGWELRDVTAEAATGSIDISAIPYADGTSTLSFELLLRDPVTASFEVDPPPYAVASWDGPPVEMCLQTTIAESCSTAEVAVDAELTFDLRRGGSVVSEARRGFEYLAGASCLQITKDVAGAPVYAGGILGVAYDVEITNPSPARAVYTLDDEFALGDVFALADARVTNQAPGGIATDPSWTGSPPFTTVAAGVPIAPGSAHRYRVDADVTIAAPPTPGAGDCTLLTDETGTGLSNRASLDGDASTDVVACVEYTSVVDAVDDALGVVAPGSTGASVLVNDTIDGQPANLPDVTIAPGAPSSAGIAIDPATGVVSMAPDAAPGSYTAPYVLCSTAEPAVCDTATVTAEIPEPATTTTTIPEPATTTTTISEPATTTTTTTTTVPEPATTTTTTSPTDPPSTPPPTSTTSAVPSPTTTPEPGSTTTTPSPATTPGSATTVPSPTTTPEPTLTTTTPSPATTPGSATTVPSLTTTPGSTTTVQTTADRVAVDATDDLFGVLAAGSRTRSVLSDDLVDDAPATVGNAALTPHAAPHERVRMHADGVIEIDLGVQPGTYVFGYTICSRRAPAVCDAASASFTVAAFELPETGGDARRLVGAATWLLAVGGVALIVARARRHQPSR